MRRPKNRLTGPRWNKRSAQGENGPKKNKNLGSSNNGETEKNKSGSNACGAAGRYSSYQALGRALAFFARAAPVSGRSLALDDGGVLRGFLP